uniref:Ubiquitin-like domain-containing protein n=1 Tax=Mantoniella antarctica TaxID=81844 RepID=A0A7S0SDZ4_9CHLO|mmetsp:Transcript_19014/g.47135  ORF Transcript_19014/g.47135 Transcript_19014/m.47135 type:complete len:107 (+) Transcript_19014:31-351(+)
MAEEEKKEVVGHINLVVKNADGAEVQFKVKYSTKFQKIIDAYCVKKGIEDQALVKFVFDGARLDKNLTPKDMDMEDGDSIDVFAEQLGGAAATAATTSHWGLGFRV